MNTLFLFALALLLPLALTLLLLLALALLNPSVLATLGPTLYCIDSRPRTQVNKSTTTVIVYNVYASWMV